MSLRQKIVALLNGSNKKMTMQEIYTHFPEIAKTTIRGRVYNSLGKGIERIGKGIYISSQAIVEHGSTIEIIDRMIEEGDLFDFIFLDIPYDAAGQRGGNRNLFDCDKISPQQFQEFIVKCEKLLKTDNSPIAFMFTSGKSSKKAHDEYINKIPLKRCEPVWTYQKLWSNGRPMNMGKYLMPKENIYFFSRSGKMDFEVDNVEFALTPDLKEYPTAKPYEMIKKIVGTFTRIGDWVLDPFGGSGKTLKACLELNRMCHIIDISDTSINKHIIPLLSFK